MTDLIWGEVADMRILAGITLTDYSDAELQDFLKNAQKEVNSKLISKIVREPVYFLDEYRSNKIDGTNKLFFLKHWRGNLGTNYIGDYNYDNKIDTTDLRVTQYDPNTQLESDVTITSIDITNCSFTLTIAPSNVQLYVSYAYIPLDPVVPTGILKQCVSYLASSYTFIGTDGFIMQFGNVKIQPGQSGGKGKQLYEKYEELFRLLQINSNGGAVVGEMVSIDDVLPYQGRVHRYGWGYNLNSPIP
jgi:hypothetical protein